VDDELALGLLLVAGGWSLVLALALGDARAARGAASGEAPSVVAPPWWAGRALWVLALLVVGVRAPLAIGRPVRQVDEYQYAATVAFARASGEGLLGAPVGARGVTALWLVAGTGLLLGQTLLRALGRPGPALLVMLAYPWGLLRFEGLTSCGEAWVGLALAGWVRLRLAGPDDLSTARRVAAGACLGLGVLMKEHALPFLLLPPALAALELRGSAGPERGRAFLTRSGLALAGACAPLLLVVLALAARGTLGELLEAYLAFGRGLGDPGAPGAATGRSLAEVVIELAAGLLTLLPGVVSGLGLVQLLRRTGELGTPPATPQLRLACGLVLLGLVALACASLGLRFFSHYFQLALPALAPLCAWRLCDAAREVRSPRAAVRWLAAIQLGLAALLLAGEVRLLRGFPRFAEGNSLERRGDGPSEADVMRGFADGAAAVVPGDRPIFVWGWRPELYAFARRAPSSRWLAGWLLRVPPARIQDDLERWPPGAVLLPGPRGLLPGSEAGEDPYALERHPWLEEWLRAHRFRRLDQPGGARLYLPE
jgi:hypothetical protein